VKFTSPALDHIKIDLNTVCKLVMYEHVRCLGDSHILGNRCYSYTCIFIRIHDDPDSKFSCLHVCFMCVHEL